MSKIVAVVVVDKERIDGGAPIFIAKDADEQKKLAFSLEKVLDVSAHLIDEEYYILVDHGKDS